MEYGFNEYQEQASRTINERLDLIEKTQHALHGMAAEVGEVHGLYQKIYQGHDVREEELKKELGDLMWFVAEYCTAMGWAMEEVARMNIEKLMRRYPEGFDEERSRVRHEEAGGD